VLLNTVLVATVVVVQGDRAAPRCEAEPGRRAEAIRGEVVAGSSFSRSTPGGWILRLTPSPGSGWLLSVSTKGRESEDLSRLTPPWHFVPNPREIEGWRQRASGASRVHLLAGGGRIDRVRRQCDVR
jgi:hypothetical protein